MDIYSFKDTGSKSGPMDVDPLSMGPMRYKIPVAPANYQSQVVESLRASVNSMPEPVGHNGPWGSVGWVGGWLGVSENGENEKNCEIVGYFLYC